MGDHRLGQGVEREPVQRPGLLGLNDPRLTHRASNTA